LAGDRLNVADHTAAIKPSAPARPIIGGPGLFISDEERPKRNRRAPPTYRPPRR